MSDLIGKKIMGHYTVLDKVGEGGMATVYKAKDMRLGRLVALKFIRTNQIGSDNRASILRFDQEAKALAKLNHPNIVHVLDYGKHQKLPFLVMDYLPGGTLLQKMEHPIPWQEAISILLPIADGLAYAHQHGVLHRDIKPANILLNEDGNLVLSDFGISKLLEIVDVNPLTNPGTGIGSPGYMAPEQLIGTTMDVRTDVFALGIVLYEMLTGHKPYNAEQLIFQSKEPLLSPRTFCPDLPERLERILTKALALNHRHRYQDMNSFRSALRSLLVGVDDQPASTEEAMGLRENKALNLAGESINDQPVNGVIISGSHNVIGTVLSHSNMEETRIQNSRESVRASAPEAEETSSASNEKRKGLTKIGLAIISAVGSIIVAVITAPWFAGIIGNSQTPTAMITATLSQPPLITMTASIAATITPIPTTTPRPTPLTPYPAEMKDKKGVIMSLVPSGSFFLGSAGGNPDEQPVLAIYLNAFYIDRYEVTNAAYRSCVDENFCEPPSQIRSATRANYYGNAMFDNFPVIFVNWNMAKQYCEWRGAYLPTEAQWEKAAKGTGQFTYPWGEGLDCTYANYGGANTSGCQSDTSVVGKYKKGESPYGVYDMAGNVEEWVKDWYDYSHYLSLSNGFIEPQGPATGSLRVVRGGSWSYPDNNVTTTNRNAIVPSETSAHIGFRCVSNP